MFDFEKLDLYEVVRNLNYEVYTFLNDDQHIDPLIKDKWKKATLDILMNLAEGTGRIALHDKKYYITNARGGANESVSLLQLSKDLNMVDEEKYNELYERYEQVSKMLLGMYRSYTKPKTEKQQSNSE